MMHHLNFGSYVPNSIPCSYHLDAFQASSCNSQMALSQVNQRLSRATTSTTSTRPRAESSSRISKPNSASTSPGLSRTSRRRTMASDSQSTRRHEQAIKYITATLGLGEGQLPQVQAHAQAPAQAQGEDEHHHHHSRPVSWHPSTHMQQSLQHYQDPQASSFVAPATYFQPSDFYTPASHYSPEMTSAFSSSASPTASFSALPVPYGCADGMGHVSTDGWHYGERGPSSSLFPALSDSLYAGEQPCATAFHSLMGSPSGLDWNGFMMQGYSTTSPPTPDTFLSTTMATQLPQPAMSDVYYPSSADESEDEGEILVGMGLYDDKREEDPQLNNYRYTVSSLLGTAFRPQEPKGKGLKLEETWEPPKSDDEDEDEEDEPEE